MAWMEEQELACGAHGVALMAQLLRSRSAAARALFLPQMGKSASAETRVKCHRVFRTKPASNGAPSLRACL